MALMRAAGLQPLEPYPGTVTPWRCQCLTCGAEVTPTHDRVKQTGRGCAPCAYKRRGIRRRVDSDQAVALMRTAGFEPLEPYPLADAPWACRCTQCGHTVRPTYNSVRQGTGCGFCSGKAVDPEEAAEVMRAAGLEPLEPYRTGKTPWLCHCVKCGRNPRPTYSHVLSRGTGCGYCGGKLVDADEAVEIMRECGFEPLVPYPGSLSRWPSRCTTCGRKVSPWFASVKSQGTRCRYCQRNSVDPDEAAALLRSRGLEPLVEYPGAGTPWPCKCIKCGKTVTPTYGTVRVGGGCKFCATKGINLNAPCLVYLVTHEALNAHKVGIGSPSGYRLEMHQRQGWQVYRTLMLDTGEAAFDVESAVLQWLRSDLGIPAFLTKDNMPQRGESETMCAEDIALPKVWAKVLYEARKQQRRAPR